MDIAVAVFFGAMIGVGFMAFGFWMGFIFLKRQLPNLPKPEVRVENHNEIIVPQKPVIEGRTPQERQSDATAEFVSGL